MPQRPKSIFDLIPLKLVLALARPYLAGHAAKEAIQAAHHIYESRRFTGTLDVLGEDSQDAQDCQGFVEKYKSLIDAVKSHPLAVTNPRQQLTISMKPSMFSTMAPEAGAASEKALEAAFDRISQVVDYALKNEINMTLGSGRSSLGQLPLGGILCLDQCWLYQFRHCCSDALI